MELIDRQTAIEAFQMFRKYDSNRSNKDWVDRIEAVLKNQPTIKAETGPHYCRECKWSWCHIDVGKHGETETYWRCLNWDGETDEEGFCHEWERRTDERFD